jgi:hypothetical protein
LFSVVGPVLVDVVYKLTFLGLYHNPVEADEPSSAVEEVTAHQVTILVLIPTAALYQSKVFNIEQELGLTDM